jgi:hypothetical protein
MCAGDETHSDSGVATAQYVPSPLFSQADRTDLPTGCEGGLEAPRPEGQYELSPVPCSVRSRLIGVKGQIPASDNLIARMLEHSPPNQPRTLV